MIIGKDVFVRSMNGSGKWSSLPLSFLITLDSPHYLANGDLLEWEALGKRPAISIQCSGYLQKSIQKKEVDVVLGPDEVIQGTRARAIRKGDTLKTFGEGDAKVVRVRGHSNRSIFDEELYRVNLSEADIIHGILIDEEDQTNDE